ncbi:ABC-2 transporter permease [Sporosarcina cascadiensis]|uniref:ABC-2 transporter permease n=1 Tax=Sporosarcina cascadiensis TaxID=2660747 RepID=UPI00129BF129|nr:ABC-2 transporter permease [Sporosarcina cascadiensis]
MLLLIKKDLAIHKLSWLLYFAMLVFFMSFNKDIIFVIALISAIIIMNTFYYDELANGHRLWNTLPFTRKEIVSARYYSLLVNISIVAAVVLLITFIPSTIFTSPPSLMSTWEEVIGSFVVMTISASLFFPLVYKLAEKKSIFTFVILYILSVIAGVYGLYYSYDYLIRSSVITPSSIGLFWGMLAASSFIFYLLSWGLSLRIYKAKEIL